MKDHIGHAVLRTLPRVTDRRLWDTERGFVGQFNVEFQAVVGQLGVLPADTVTEQEYQKRFREHGIRSRPDLIVHIPYDPDIVSSRREGNFVVFEFKNRAYRKKAHEDLKKLNKYVEALNYDVGVFVNINASQCYLGTCELDHVQHIHEFAVARSDGDLVIGHAYWTSEGGPTIDRINAAFEKPS